jgi:hypothetical protein
MGEAGTLMPQDAANRFSDACGRSGIGDAPKAKARWFAWSFEQPAPELCIALICKN